MSGAVIRVLSLVAAAMPSRLAINATSRTNAADWSTDARPGDMRQRIVRPPGTSEPLNRDAEVLTGRGGNVPAPSLAPLRVERLGRSPHALKALDVGREDAGVEQAVPNLAGLSRNSISTGSGA